MFLEVRILFHCRQHLKKMNETQKGNYTRPHRRTWDLQLTQLVDFLFVDDADPNSPTKPSLRRPTPRHGAAGAE